MAAVQMRLMAPMCPRTKAPCDLEDYQQDGACRYHAPVSGRCVLNVHEWPVEAKYGEVSTHMSLAQVARELGISAERVRGIESEALEKIDSSARKGNRGALALLIAGVGEHELMLRKVRHRASKRCRLCDTKIDADSESFRVGTIDGGVYASVLLCRPCFLPDREHHDEQKSLECRRGNT